MTSKVSRLPKMAPASGNLSHLDRTKVDSILFQLDQELRGQLHSILRQIQLVQGLSMNCSKSTLHVTKAFSIEGVEDFCKQDIPKKPTNFHSVRIAMNSNPQHRQGRPSFNRLHYVGKIAWPMTSVSIHCDNDVTLRL